MLSCLSASVCLRIRRSLQTSVFAAVGLRIGGAAKRHDCIKAPIHANTSTRKDVFTQARLHASKPVLEQHARNHTYTQERLHTCTTISKLAFTKLRQHAIMLVRIYARNLARNHVCKQGRLHVSMTACKEECTQEHQNARTPARKGASTLEHLYANISLPRSYFGASVRHFRVTWGEACLRLRIDDWETRAEA
jgi:hypothetical protein